jgi:hypothetical protein
MLLLIMPPIHGLPVHQPTAVSAFDLSLDVGLDLAFDVNFEISSRG